MRILHVIATMDPRAGGPCQGIRNLVPYMMQHGHIIEVVCLDDPRAPYLEKEPVCVHALGNSVTPWAYNPALRGWLDDYLTNYDAVILNGLWQYPGYLMSQMALRPECPPFVVFPHGMLDPWFQRAPERRLKAVRNWVYWKLIERKVIARAAAMMFTCAEEMRLAQATFWPYRPQRQINAGYGVDQPPAFHERMLTAFAEKCPGLNGRNYLLFLSRIHEKKGVGLLLHAYATVYGKRPDAPALVIAGPGLDSDYGRSMVRLAERICPPNSVLWPGMVSGDAKWGAFYGSEAFVLTSHQENFGIAVAESLACGRPVLISNQINIWREIAEDKAGFVAPDTGEGAEQLLADWSRLTPVAKQEMNRAAMQSYENRFGVAQAAHNLSASLQMLVAERREQGQGTLIANR